MNLSPDAAAGPDADAGADATPGPDATTGAVALGRTAAGPAVPAPPQATVRLMGLTLHDLTAPELVDRVVGAAAAGTGGWIVNPNVDVLRQIVADPPVRALVEGADLVVADGMPLLWAAALQRTPIRQTVPVSDAIWALCAEAARRGVPVFLLGGAPGSAAKAAQVLAGRYPGLEVSHMCPPFGFERDEAGLGAVRDALQQAAPGLVFCAFGFPKQERLTAQLRDQCPSAWFIGSGGTFSMVAGDTPKAPAWARRLGLEWAHRLRLEPRRLFRRYIVDDLPFAARLLGGALLARVGTRRTSLGAGAGAEPPTGAGSRPETGERAESGDRA